MKLVNFSIKIFIGLLLLISVAVCFKTENTFSSESRSETALNHGIFMKDKVFKYKGKKAVSKSKSFSTKKASSNSKNRLEQSPLPSATAPTPAAASAAAGSASSSSNSSSSGSNKSAQPSGPILHKGWIKFFKFSTRYGTVLPNSFSINTQFYEQLKYFPNADLKKKVDGVFEFIRDNKFFFLHLFENKLTINSSLHVNI